MSAIKGPTGSMDPGLDRDFFSIANHPDEIFSTGVRLELMSHRKSKFACKKYPTVGYLQESNNSLLEKKERKKGNDERGEVKNV